MNAIIQQHLDTLILWAKHDPRVEALIGLGSISQPARLDRYSDMDFFLIVNQASKSAMIANLDWLAPLGIATHFQNTVDGHKVLLKDGTLIEFAVFYLEELVNIPYHHPKIFYAKTETVRQKIPLKNVEVPRVETRFHVQEALSQLYVGLLREHRGEHVAAHHMIQHIAVQQTIGLTRTFHPGVDVDPFNVTRRLEQLDRATATWVNQAIGGINHNRQSARIILDVLKQFQPDHHWVKAIERLL